MFAYADKFCTRSNIFGPMGITQRTLTYVSEHTVLSIRMLLLYCIVIIKATSFLFFLAMIQDIPTRTGMLQCIL